MGWLTRVLFPAGAGILSLRPCIQTSPGVNPPSYPIGTGALSSPTSI